MHYGAGSHLDDMLWEKRRWNGSQAYAETKFQDVLLAFAIRRRNAFRRISTLAAWAS